MDFTDTREEAEYRGSLREWLREYMADRVETPTRREWQRALYENGYVGQTWTVEEGGRGLPATYDAILHDEIAEAGAPPVPPNLAYLGRSILEFGTDEQRARFLGPTMNGDIIWCQGFSEPGAGSDLAAMRTRAELVGDEWVINGQKLWTGGAKLSDWCFLLARTEPDAPKHKGISVLLVDMTTPGVKVQPLRTSDGSFYMCETFFDDVHVPAENILGGSGEGWSIAQWALQLERGPARVGIVAPLLRSFRQLEATAWDQGLDDSVDVRRTLAKTYVDLQVLDLNARRQLSSDVVGQAPGADGPVAKLLWSMAAQSLGRAWVDTLGADALSGADDGHALEVYFHELPTSVYGGSAQIQRNQLSQRFMGMPRAGR